MRRQIVFFFHIFPQNFNLLFFLNPQLYINQIVHINSWVKSNDARIPALIRNGVQEKQRSFFIIVGDKARNQLPNLHYLMMSADLKMNKSVLWAYKKNY